MTTTSQARFKRSHLIDALVHEYEFLCHDDFDPDVDPSPAEYRAMLATFSNDELFEESGADDIDDYITHWL